MDAPSGEEGDQLAAAYEQRTSQLHEARGALAEAVLTLKTELQARRNEAAAFREDTGSLREDHRALVEQAAAREALIQKLQERNAELEAEIDAMGDQLRSLRAMRVVRWTAWPRRLADRLRSHR